MPPKSPRTKMREYRERMGEEKKKEMKEKNKEQAKKYRASMSEEKRKAERLSNTRRKREARRKAKVSSVSPKHNPLFSIVQSEGKAIRKVVNSLPQSPRRKIAVLKKLAVQHGILVEKSKTSRRNLFESENLTKMITSFYENDEISRQSPGKKDFVTVKDSEGNKQQIQKRVMLMNIMEAFQQFKKERPDIKVGKSNFAQLRPQHVVTITEKDHHVCCCIYHENLELLPNGLRSYNNEVPKPEELISSSLCQDPTTSCSLGTCDKCHDVTAIIREKIMLLFPLTHPNFAFYQWGKNSKKELIEMALDDLEQELRRQLQTMRIHSFLAKHQLHQIKTLKNSLTSTTTAILQEDFAENFSLKQQNEIMTAHWNSAGVTIFTAIVYFSKQNYASFALVSDCLEHDKFAVATYNRIILKELENAGRTVEELHVFSDGCGGQFKNCANLSLMTQPAMLHPKLKTMDWSFFATSHGKGPIDGIGGTVKRAVWRRILRGTAVINSAEQFADEAKTTCTNINVIYVSKNQVAETQTELETFWRFNQPKIIPETRSFHFFKPTSKTTISAASISPFTNLCVDKKSFQIFRPTSAKSTTLSTPTVDPSSSQGTLCNDTTSDVIISAEQYYAVDYVDRFYIGRVLNSNKPDIWNMKVLHKTTVGGISYFSWPERDDTDAVHRQAIFYGPVNLEGCLQSTIPDLNTISAAFASRKDL